MQHRSYYYALTERDCCACLTCSALHFFAIAWFLLGAGAWFGHDRISGSPILRYFVEQPSAATVRPPIGSPVAAYTCVRANNISSLPTPRDYCAEGVQPGSDIAEFPALSEWIPCDQLQRLQHNGDIVASGANCGFADFAVNFVRAHKRLGRNNVLIVAEDCAAYRLLSKELGHDHVAKPLLPPTTQFFFSGFYFLVFRSRLQALGRL
jgi:hypothetical protein